jgi:acyl dehydratase
MASEGLIMGKLTDETIDLMRRRIGYPNPTLRAGIHGEAWNVIATADAIRRWSLCIGDDNPFFIDPDYAAKTRWGGTIAPPAFEKSMGLLRNKTVPDSMKDTNKALRGVQLFHSGGENFYYKPIVEGTKLYRTKWVSDVQVKESEFAGRSAIVSNRFDLWDDEHGTYSDGTDWFVHAERKRRSPDEKAESKKKKNSEPAKYTDEQIAEIEAAYDSQYLRGADTLFLEDVKIGDIWPKMVKGPLTITDMINFHMGAGWLIYGNWPYRLAYENRKKLRGFYSKDAYGNWDTVQRVHWDKDLANEVGIPNLYDIGALRQTMVSNYLTNSAGDDAWIYRIRFEFRAFNYMGDTTWLSGKITDARIDPILGPLIEVDITGTNQRGIDNIRANATVLIASKETGLAKLPPQPGLRDRPCD